MSITSPPPNSTVCHLVCYGKTNTIYLFSAQPIYVVVQLSTLAQLGEHFEFVCDTLHVRAWISAIPATPFGKSGSEESDSWCDTLAHQTLNLSLWALMRNCGMARKDTCTQFWLRYKISVVWAFNCLFMCLFIVGSLYRSPVDIFLRREEVGVMCTNMVHVSNRRYRHLNGFCCQVSRLVQLRFRNGVTHTSTLHL